MKKLLMFLCTFCLVLMFVGTAGAALMRFTDRPDFENQGSIAYNYGFEEGYSGGITYLSNPLTLYGVIYTGPGGSVILGPGAEGYNLSSNVLSDYSVKYLDANLGSEYDLDNYNMLGFDLGGIHIPGGTYTDSSVKIDIWTSTGAHYYYQPEIIDLPPPFGEGTTPESGTDFLLTAPSASAQVDGSGNLLVAGDMNFYGFVADPGEYFTAFQFEMIAGDASAAIALDNVTLGNVGNPVPEPATMLLLGTGLVGLAGFRRKFKK